ncbi:MAG: hypothetical protein KBD78_03930 [Oligoflexales bacterium]|nr:hypothetical protein [Oligoflexales bacterium]
MGKKGDAPEPSRPYQGPDFGLQNNLLSAAVLGNFLGANRQLTPLLGSPSQNQTQNVTPNSRAFLQNTFNSGGSNYGGSFSNAGQPQRGQGGKGGSSNAEAFSPQGFTQAGQYIPGQIASNTTFNLPAQTTASYNQLPQLTTTQFNNRLPQITTTQFNNRIPQITTPSYLNYSPYQFNDPGAQFVQRGAYQFQETPRVNVGDIYSPQMDLARRQIEETTRRSLEQQMADLNARGMLTTGAGNRATASTLQESGRQLADLASQYSLAQSQAQLQEDQARRQMEQQRQISQAEEIFRQQGATDQQAQFLANQNLNLQNAQAGQNLSAFNTNLGAQQQAYGQDLSNYNARLSGQQQAYGQGLSNFNAALSNQQQAYNQGLSNYNAGLSAQQQAFGQDLSRNQLLGQQQAQQFNQLLQGRQQATSEEQLANLMRRQPLEDLFRLWQQQAGPTGPTQGSPGILGTLGGIAGGLVGSMAGPVGAGIGKGIGSSIGGFFGNGSIFGQ